jgi:O-antigen ligase
MQIATRAHFAVLKARQLTLVQLFVLSLPVFLGLALGFFTFRGDWLYAFALAMLAPMALLFSARPFIGVILWLLLMPLYSVFPNRELMYWVIHRILITITLFMALLPRLANSSRLPRFRLGPIEVCIALLAIYVPISILISGRDLNVVLTRGYIERMLIPFAMYLIMRLSVFDHWKQRLLQWTVFFIALSQCTIGLLSWFLPGVLPPLWLSFYTVRMSGSLLNPNVYAVVLMFCAILLFQSALNRQPGLIRSVFLLACGVSALCVFLSMERAVWLGAAAVIVGLFILYPKPMLRYITIAGVVFLLVGAGFLAEKINMANARLKSQSQVDVRIVIMDAMVQMFQAKPVLGWGYGTINQYISQYYRQVDSYLIDRFETSHNTYLTILVELGLVGFILYLFPVVWLFAASVQAWRGPPKMESAQRLLLGVLWLAVLQHFIVSNFMDMRFFSFAITLWWMNLGLIANLVYQHAESRDRYLSSPAAQTWRQGQSVDESLLGTNGAGWY